MTGGIPAEMAAREAEGGGWMLERSFRELSMAGGGWGWRQGGLQLRDAVGARADRALLTCQ